MKRWILYRHTSPSGKVYIGITSKTANKRWNNGRGYSNCTYFYNAILKYGWDNIKHEILFTDLDESRAKSLEIELIRHYKSLGISYNMTNRGDGYLGYTPPKEVRRKLSELAKNRTHTCSEEARNKIRESHLRNLSSYKSQEFRDKISKAVDYKKSKVSQFTLGGEYLRSFSSANEAEKFTSISRGAILRCCKGKVRRAGNFIWKYYGEGV